MSEWANTTALFPGAFRPPHVNHYQTVTEQLRRDDVDEVIVIVSGRPRSLPGGRLAMSSQVSEAVWREFLGAETRVRVTVAEGGAVEEATRIVIESASDHRFRLCVGQKDYLGGTGRFAKALRRIEAVHDEPGKVEVVAGADDVIECASRDMRRWIHPESRDRSAFLAALPKHLDSRQRRSVLALCESSVVSASKLAADAARELVATHVGDVDAARPLGLGLDAAVEVDLADRRTVYVKSAAGTVRNTPDGVDMKPRGRIKAEHQALSWIRERSAEVHVPQALLRHRPSRSLVVSAVCPRGTSLEDQLAQGRFDTLALGSVGRWIARCAAATPDEALWGSEDDDLAAWHRTLEATTARAAALAPDLVARMERVGFGADTSVEATFAHLDLVPSNVRVGPGAGVIDFECSSSRADPTFDIGRLAGHVLAWGLHSQAVEAALLGVEALCEGFLAGRPDLERRLMATIAVGLCEWTPGAHGVDRTPMRRKAMADGALASAAFRDLTGVALMLPGGVS